jgi:hypothetical protein
LAAVRVALLAVALFVIAACGDGSSLGLVGPSSGLATQEPLATEEPMATLEPSAPPDLTITVTRQAGTVARGAAATLAIQTAKKAGCRIVVQYDSGPSTAKGLADKTADSSGTVIWKWTVGRTTHRGEVPIVISCSLGDQSGNVETSFTVK